MRGNPRRTFRAEELEQRVVLSASPCHDECTVSIVNDVSRGAVSTEAVIAWDNTTRHAQDLGELRGSLSFSDYVGRFDERDVYRFELSGASEAVITLDHMFSDADLYLLDANRNVIGRSTHGDWRSERIQADLPVGEYYVVVQRFGIWSSTSYTLGLTAIPPTPNMPADGAGNTFATATDIGVLPANQQFAGFVGGDDTADVLQFTVEATSQASIRLSELTQDIDLYLYSADDREVDHSIEPGSTSEGIDAILAPGTYYLGIVPFETASSSYTLSVGSAIVSVPPPLSPGPGEVGGDPAAAPAGEPPVVEPLAEVPYVGASRDWGINAVNAPEAWAAGYHGEGVIVAVVDTGIQLDHPDLWSNIWVNVDEVAGDGIDNDHNGFVDDLHGWDFASGDNDPTDGNSHGTHVAGTIAAADNGSGVTGVAYAAQLLPIRVLDDAGSGSSWDVAQGIRYAVDNGAAIINLSLGGGYSSDIYSAIAYAEQQDVLIVAASGNEHAGTPGYPARHSSNLKNVISVGAFDGSGQLASFSNKVGNSQAVQIDAPGVSVYSTLPGGGYGYLSGTSMATPHVAGVAALTLSANPNMTSAELRAALAIGADRVTQGSDAIGGVNAAMSIPWALHGVEVAAAANGGGTLVGTSVGSIGRRAVSSSLGQAVVIVNRPRDAPSVTSAFDVGPRNAEGPPLVDVVGPGWLDSRSLVVSIGSFDVIQTRTDSALPTDISESVFAEDALFLAEEPWMDSLA